jgi:AcrR family transcriptional regulator
VTGLRDRKKQAVRRRIIEAAEERFVASGLDATTIEEIAAAAEVSVGTVYNYFGSKNALLVAGVESDTAEMIERGTAILTRPGTNPTKAVQRLFAVYLDQLASWDPQLLREVLSASLQRIGGTELTVELVRLDERLLEQLAALLAGFQRRNRLHPAVAPAEAALLLFSTLLTQLFMFLALDGFDRSMLSAQVDRQVEVVFLGLTPPSDEKAK